MDLTVLEFDGFDWDNGNLPKIQERVPAEIVEEFFLQTVLVKEDARHSQGEARFVAMGFTEHKRCLLVAYTWRQRGGLVLIRPISARYTHQSEVRAYEEAVKKVRERKK